MSIHTPTNPHGTFRDVLSRFAARHGRAPRQFEKKCLFYHWKMHQSGGGQTVGAPIVDLMTQEFKVNPYKVGQPMAVDTAMSEFKYSPFKSGNERRNAMLGYTRPDPFKMGYTRTDPYKMGYDRPNPFKMGQYSYALGAEELALADAIVGAAKQGSPKAKAIIKKTVARAKQGSPKAKRAVKALRTADARQKQRARISRPGKFLLDVSKEILHTPMFAQGLRAQAARTR